MGAAGLSSRAIIGRFYQKLEADIGASWVGDLSWPSPSDQESETYKWLGMSPAMREWLGGRQPKGLSDKGITIANKTYEATLEVSVDELRRDKTGQILVRVDEMAGRAAAHWANLLSSLILANGVCYDGQNFFDTDHSEGSSGTQLNALAVGQVPSLKVTTAASPTAAEMQDAILDVISYMLGYKDDQGEPINELAKSWLIMCPVGKIWASALAAVKNEVINQSTNTLKNVDFSLKVVCNPRLTGTTVFYVGRTDASVKALIRQEEVPIEMKAIAEGSELEFENNVHHYGINASRNVGYGYWQHMSQCTLS
jgi:phage major head subunit gpT-like protein